MAEAILSQEEVDALLNGVNGDHEETVIAEDTGIRPYNLATEERIVRGRMPSLEMINEEFSRLFRIGLGNFVHRPTEISSGTVKIAKYGDFVRNLVVPANINLINMKPLRGTALLVIDPSLVFLMVDNVFGGTGRFHTRVEGRDFTETETRIIRRVLAIVFDNYAKSWARVFPLECEYVRSEMNTQFVHIAMPSEVVIVTTFKVEIGTVAGEMHFCIPYSMIEPIRSLLTSSVQSENVEVDKRWVRLMKQQVQDATVELVVNLGTTEITLGEILNMKVGDIVAMTIPDTVTACVDDIPIVEGGYGLLNGQYAIRVDKLLTNHSTESTQGEEHG